MANYFGVNSEQANLQYEQVVSALDKISKDNTPNKGRGDSNMDLINNLRHAENGVTHEPWIMSTTEWLTPQNGNPPKGIVWFANPSDASWSLSQRSTISKHLTGTVMHVWANNSRGTFFDEPRVTLTLQTGNLMPVLGLDGKWQVSGGIINFYDFMQLFDAPKLTVGTPTSPPKTNLVSIQYHSNLFPSITLLGMFDPSTGIKFTDSSSSPASPTGWTVDFVVFDTVPKLSTFSGQQTNSRLLQNWIDAKVDKKAVNRNPSYDEQENSLLKKYPQQQLRQAEVNRRFDTQNPLNNQNPVFNKPISFVS